MTEELTKPEPRPECVKCRKEIEECTWVYYGGHMRSKGPLDPEKVEVQVYWCEPCFKEYLLPIFEQET